MIPENQGTPKDSNTRHAAPGQPAGKETRSGDDEKVIAAHEQAEEDIQNDPDLSIHSPNDDLDEGETARLGDGENALI